MHEQQHIVSELIYRSCMLFDEEKFEDWLDLCTRDFHYSTEAFSAEIEKPMTWLSLNRTAFENLLKGISSHHRLPGRFFRQPMVLTTEAVDAQQAVAAITALSVYFTDFEGQSKLFAVGRYYDTVDLSSNAPLLQKRVVRLETRMFMEDCAGTHVPI